MYDCKWASDGELMCRGSSGQEGADLPSRCITLVAPLLMVTTHLYFLLPIGHLPVGRTRRKTKTNLPFSGFVHDLDNMTSLHIFEFLEKFGKLIQFGGGGRPLVIQIITLDVLGLFCPSKQMPQNSHPTKLFPFHMGDFVLTFHFICWVILSDFDSSEKLNDVSETRRQL